MLEFLLNEIKQELLEVGRTFCLYTVQYYCNNSTKDNHISSWNVFQFKFFNMIIVIFYALKEPLEVLLRLPKAIKKSHSTTASRNTIMTKTLEELPLKKINEDLGLWCHKNGEWYLVEFDNVFIFVRFQPSHKNVKRFYRYVNNKVLKYSGNQLQVTFPEYRTGEINVLYMKIVEVKHD